MHEGDPHRPTHELLTQTEDPNVFYRIMMRALKALDTTPTHQGQQSLRHETVSLGIHTTFPWARSMPHQHGLIFLALIVGMTGAELPPYWHAFPELTPLMVSWLNIMP